MYNFISSNLLVSLWKLLRLSTAQSSPNTFRSIRRRQVHTSLIWECSTFSTACATMLWRMPIPIYGRTSSGKMWSSLRPKAYALVLRRHNHIAYLCACFKSLGIGADYQQELRAPESVVEEHLIVQQTSWNTQSTIRDHQASYFQEFDSRTMSITIWYSWIITCFRLVTKITLLSFPCNNSKGRML